MSTDAKKIADKPSSEEQPSKPASYTLQWVREGIAGIISLVLLVIAALMMYGTYSYARQTPLTADATLAASHKESYERQKDILMYALALLGTVTGYYLGRVPAELHAQQAERSANTAQNQLQKTQTKLTDTVDKAAIATGEATIAERDKNAAKTALNRTVSTLIAAESAISKALSRSPETKVLGESTRSMPHADLEDLIRAKEKIRSTLREMGENTNPD